MNNPLVQLDPGLFVWTILTFLLLLTVLAKFAWKPLLKMLKDREELIRSSLEDAEKAKEKLERLNAEGEAIINQARSEAQSMKLWMLLKNKPRKLPVKLKNRLTLRKIKP